MNTIDIELFHHQQWHLAATFSLSSNEALRKGYKGPGLLAYETLYAIDHINQAGITALSARYPVGFDMIKTTAWPAFLLDLLPTGAGRRALLNLFHETDQGAQSDWLLLLRGASNPPGNLRIKQAADLLESKHHPGFSESDIVERAEMFIEYARGHGAPISGSLDIQGDAPKFLLTLDQNDRWHADGILPDSEAKQHFIVKFPRGHLNSDRAVLRNEASYYQVAQAAGLRVHNLPTWINNTLFIPRFDRKVENQCVIRYGQESLCSLAGIADFGQAIPMEQLVAAFMPYVTQPEKELIEFLLRDILNVALGNTDNHARNTAISKYPDHTIALSPLYDFAPMILDEQGIARVCRWSEGEILGFPEWGKIADIVAKQFAKYQINAKDLRQLFFQFSNTVRKLPDIMIQAKVETDLIERLQGRINTVFQSLMEAKPL